jgi:hypothetical protein
MLGIAGLAVLIGVAAIKAANSGPNSPAGWYQAGNTWIINNGNLQGNPAMVGYTSADYCSAAIDQAGLISGNPISNMSWAGSTLPAPSPVPQSASDITSWINGCAAGVASPSASTPAVAAPAPAPADSAPDAATAPTTPSSGNTGQSDADSAAEQQAQTDLSTVQGISFSSDLAALRGDVQVTTNDAATLKAAVATGPGVGGECAGSSAIDAASGKLFSPFGSDDQSSFSHATTLQQDISTARSDISTLQDDVSGLQTTGSPVPSGTQAAITSAQDAISQAATNGNSGIDQENALVNKALQVLNSLDTPSDQCADAIQQYEAGNPIAQVG